MQPCPHRTSTIVFPCKSRSPLASILRAGLRLDCLFASQGVSNKVLNNFLLLCLLIVYLDQYR